MKRILFFAFLLLSLASSALAQVPSYVPTSGLVGWWPFNGNANDESGNGNNGINYGATSTQDRFGSANSAFYFSGAGCAPRIEANVNTSAITSGLSISVWMLRTGDGCLSPRFMEFWPGCNCPGLSVWSIANGSSVGGITTHTSTYFMTSANFNYPNNNSWTQLIYTNDGSIAKFYQDGNLIISMPSSGNPSLASNAAFGRMNHPGNDAFNGKLDDIGIWNRALTPAEIQALYLSGQPCPSIANIQGPSNVNVGSNITLIDSTANGTWSSSNTSVATIDSSGVVTGVSAGTATISYIANLTCGLDTATYTITVNSLCLPSYVPTNGLVGWWPFCGNANDESGNGNHGTPMNGVALTTDRNGNGNSAYSFDGVDDYILQGGLNVHNLSFSLWFKKDSLINVNPNSGHPPIGAQIIGQGTRHQPTVTYSDFAIGLSSYNSAIESFSFENSNLFNSSWTDYNIASTSNVFPGWNQIVVTIHDTLLDFYLNGVFSNNLILTNSICHSGAPLSIGSRYVLQSFSGNGVCNFFKGKIDDIGIWNRALTPAEIQALYLSGQPCPSIANIHGPSSVNVGSTITLTDSTANGTWSSSNPSVATISASGVVTGVSAGTSTMSYIANLTCGPDTATYTITVNPNPCLPSYVPTNGLVGWWPFCGNANDESGNGNHGTVNGATLTADRFGNINSSYLFDGISNRIDLSTSQNFSFSNSDFTLSIWFYSSSMNGNHRHAIRNINWQTGAYYEISPENAINGMASFGYTVGNGLPYHEAFSNGQLVDNSKWHLLTGLKHSNFTYFFIDGKLQDSVNIGSTSTGILNLLQVGAFYYNNGSGAVSHKIDDIGIWNRALTPAEIQAMYQGGQACSVTHTTSLNLCRRDSTLWNGQYYSRTGVDTVHLTSYRGCDSVDILNLNVYPLYYTVITQYFCKGKSFVFNGQTITTAGTYYFHYTSATGCDSTVRLRALYRAPIPTTNVTLPICVGGTVSYGGQTFSSPGIYKVTLQAYNACDSVVQLTLVKRSKTYAKVTIYRCQNDSVQYYGKYYKANGVYTAIIPNRFGCDSVVTLNVLTRPGSYTVQTNYICQGDSLLYQGVYYKQTGTYFIHLTNRYGCDSTVRLRLLYNNSSSLTNVTLCQAQTYTWNGTTYTWNMPGTYVRPFINYKGCDSIATLKIYKGNCKLSGEAIGTTVTTTEDATAETAPVSALEAAHNFEMSIYPNPNTGRFTLENNCTSCKQMLVEILSLDGKLLFTQNADNSTGKINIDLNLTPGMYWVKMSNVKEGFSEVRKIIVNNE